MNASGSLDFNGEGPYTDFVHLRREGEAERRLDSLLAEGKRAAM